MRILYFDLDTMRSDHLGCNGYHRNTTPNIDRVARDGVNFTRAYCADSPCVPSRANLISGRFGVHNGVVTHWGPGCDFRGTGPDAPLFTRLLREHGYRTASFSCFPDRHAAYWFCGGWTEMQNPTLKRGNETADEINAAVLPWLRAHGREEDYFLHIHYWDSHRDFRISQEWADLFADDPPPDWPDEHAIASHQANYGPFTASELHPFSDDGRSRAPTMPDQISSVADFKRLVDAYDGATRFMDTEIGRVLETLADLECWTTPRSSSAPTMAKRWASMPSTPTTCAPTRQCTTFRW